jgi:U2 small nuclear ribonucleoprotein A'
MRITPDLVAQSPQFTNPLKDREIKLRAYKIPAIENLGATQDQFDTIDLSDNEIRKLEVRRRPYHAAVSARACYLFCGSV